MHVASRACVCALPMLAVLCGAQDTPAFPERQAPEGGMTTEQMNAKIDDLQRQVETLEQRKAEAEERANLQSQLTDLHDESKARIKDVESQLADMETEDQPTTPAQHARFDGRKKHLDAIKALSVKLLAIKDPKALEQARQVREAIEEQETAWSLVEEPKLYAAQQIEEWSKELEQDNNQYRREALEKLRQLAAQDAESRSQELALVNARREREKIKEKLIQDFYKN